MRGLITLCARGGSKGIPGKNIKVLNGKPLIRYSIEVASQFAEENNCDIVLSTDSKSIKEVVLSISDKVNIEYIRPEFLATDSAGKLDAIKDVKNFAERANQVNYDYVIDLDVTSPLRTIEDLKISLESLFNNDKAINLFSVSPANRNPYFNMVEDKGDGFIELCKKGEFLTRQSAPKVYDLNASFYIYKKNFFEEETKTVITDRTIVYEVPHLCFDLDHPIDFEFMDFLLSNQKLDFPFNY
ncbi:acylneuraminate cytidylyltransferase family protein [Myroides marinus]|uniref:acylneuraminate cytidylyltransferase family protein n=1 Tax=Myroides marinus TaxID=703342 RepID=UPI00257720A8|nr:acylneuraminate cytidylyltransferase family protein [Myroides marinus]MDM1352178.1 acylneuraminate cytidylyltransferase family protein [Myroides marinus]MDM1359383.1 acylneuraminate cytidylyltransferase family protein [Myroides marinus]MDM1366508.1 acylneuraminate cytidylyltransferase family protein [Myroides marinus]